jgi:hypothetical protein
MQEVWRTIAYPIHGFLRPYGLYSLDSDLDNLLAINIWQPK